MRKHLTYSRHLAVLFMPALILSAGCRNQGNERDHAMAAQLFAKSKALIELYTDSVKNVADSASFLRMINAFDNKLSKVNFQFPPDTDLDLTFEENDSIIRMLDKYVEIVEKKRAEIDSINGIGQTAVDSTAVAQGKSTSISQSAQLK